MAATAAAPPHPRVAPVSAFAALILALAVAGCDLLDDNIELPDTARVEITGNATEDLELVTSTNFVRVDNFEEATTSTQVVIADTVLVQPVFTQDYSIAPSHRFFVRLTNHTLVVADITLSVSFDGVVEYNQHATLSDGGALEFSEIFFGT